MDTWELCKCAPPALLQKSNYLSEMEKGSKTEEGMGPKKEGNKFLRTTPRNRNYAGDPKKTRQATLIHRMDKRHHPVGQGTALDALESGGERIYVKQNHVAETNTASGISCTSI